VRSIKIFPSYKITQQPLPSPFSNVNKAALVAASKTSSTPSPVRLEHSRYLRAPISLATRSPSSSETKWSDFFRISSMATGSLRRSFFKPTRMIGTPGNLSCASATHCRFPDCQYMDGLFRPCDLGQLRDWSPHRNWQKSNASWCGGTVSHITTVLVRLRLAFG